MTKSTSPTQKYLRRSSDTTLANRSRKMKSMSTRPTWGDEEEAKEAVVADEDEEKETMDAEEVDVEDPAEDGTTVRTTVTAIGLQLQSATAAGRLVT